MSVVGRHSTQQFFKLLILPVLCFLLLRDIYFQPRHQRQAPSQLLYHQTPPLTLESRHNVVTVTELGELLRGVSTSQRSVDTTLSSSAGHPTTLVASNSMVASSLLTNDMRNSGLVQKPIVGQKTSSSPPAESLLSQNLVAKATLKPASGRINDMRSTGPAEIIVQKVSPVQEDVGSHHPVAARRVAPSPPQNNNIPNMGTVEQVVDTKSSLQAEDVIDRNAKFEAKNVAVSHQLNHTMPNSSLQCDFLRKARPEPNTELGRAWIWLGCAGESGEPGEPVDQDQAECKTMMRKHTVIPGHSWGTLPMPSRKRWTKLKCDGRVKVDRRQRIKMDRPRPKRTFDMSACPPHNGSQPLIAVCCGTTTRTKGGWIKHVARDLSTLALFKHLLPSLGQSLECGFRYAIVVGYDEGDKWWDLRDGARLATEWFEKFRTTRVRKNIDFSLELTRVSNTVKKPGPVFAAITKRAYELGADFIYRVNDDTELAAPWATKFAQALRALDNIGVVGPSCGQGNQRILTHDFTHRSHMDIFDKTYYPPQLSDWWMDDWISMVYGPDRTWRADDVEVVHHTNEHGQRYEVDRSHSFLLEDLVAQGRTVIRSYLNQLRLDVKDHAPRPPLSGFSVLISSRGNRKRKAILARGRKRSAQILKESTHLRQRRANNVAQQLKQQSPGQPAVPPS